MYPRRPGYNKHLDTMTVGVVVPYQKAPLWVTPAEHRLLVLLTRNRRDWTQAELAMLAGYRTRGGVSRALATMRRLGIIGGVSTRGRLGRTVAWIVRGVHALVEPMLRDIEQTRRDVPTGPLGVGQHSGPEHPMDVLKRMLSGQLSSGAAYTTLR